MLFLLLTENAEIEYDKYTLLDGLIYKITESDKEALAELYKKTSSSVYGFILSVTKNPTDSEDILQETYLKIWVNADRYTAKGTPMAWILTIAKNLSLMKLREKSRHQEVEPDEWEKIFRTDDLADNIEDRYILEAALHILTEEERKVILLHAVSGLKHREISDLLEIPLPTVLSKYHRGLKKLRKYIEGVNEDD